MDISQIWTEIPGVHIGTDVYDLLEKFSEAPDLSFLPIVDNRSKPVGIVRERDLKKYAYSRFGRDLVKRHPISDFVQPCLVLPCDITLDDLLDATAGNTNPDGILLADQSRYRAVLFNTALLKLFGKRHMDNQVRMVQLQKMEAIGTLAGGIAHDLNNMLMPIIGFSELVIESVRMGETPDLSMLDDIRVSANRARETVRRIQSFSRHQTMERDDMRLGDSIREAIRLVQTSLPKTIDVDIRIDTTQDTIHGNPSEMLQILLNLCSNAAHSMKGKCGTLLVALNTHTGPLRGWSLSPAHIDGEYVHLAVSDQGEGIPEGLLPQIFVPFFTTKKQGEGTGMGLAVVHGIVARCQGHISVESKPGEGSTFHIYLPLVHKSSASLANAKLSAAHTPRREFDRTIRTLIVDDEVYITRLAKAALGRHGIEVETMNDSIEALKRIERAPGSFEALIVDQMMPGLTGLSLARRALELRPELPVILCTGYTEGVTPEEAKAEGIREFVLKPNDFNQIAAWLREWTAVPVLRPGCCPAAR